MAVAQRPRGDIRGRTNRSLCHSSGRQGLQIGWSERFLGDWRAELISPTSNRTSLSLVTTVITVLILLASVLLSGSSYGSKPALSQAAALASFSALAPIDAH